jgi:hypothetical protein
LLSSIGFLLFIIFNLNDLRIFFRLGFFLGRCWRLDWCFKGLLLLLGASSYGSSGASKARGG